MIERKLFEVYAALEEQKRKIETQQKGMKPQILAAIAEAGKPIEVDKIGTFSQGSRPKWQYSEVTQAKADDLKMWQKKEEADGTATRTEGDPYPIFKPLEKAD